MNTTTNTKTGSKVLDGFVQQATDLGLTVEIEDSSSNGIIQYAVKIRRPEREIQNWLDRIDNSEYLYAIATKGTSEYSSNRFSVSVTHYGMFSTSRKIKQASAKYWIAEMAARQG